MTVAAVAQRERFLFEVEVSLTRNDSLNRQLLPLLWKTNARLNFTARAFAERLQSGARQENASKRGKSDEP